MALTNNDLLVVQSQDDGQLYKLSIGNLDAHLEGGSGIQFRGQVDLNNGAVANGVTLPAANGDLYIVESDAATINADWIMEGGAGVGTASENDRIIWDEDSGYWVLVSGGSNTGGIVESIDGTTPIQVNSDNPTTPVITIDQATTTDPGAVARLATDAEVAHDGAGATDAVVTANQLKATNQVVEGLTLAAGGVQTVTTTDAAGNSALSISPTAGNVVIELATAADDGSAYGVVQVASASDITNGTAGASAVVTAEQLKAVSDSIPVDPLSSITEGGTDIITGALQIAGDTDLTIGVNKDVFCPFDFDSLPDITA